MNLLAEIRATPAAQVIPTSRRYAGGTIDQARAALTDPDIDGRQLLLACATIHASSDDDEERAEVIGLLTDLAPGGDHDGT